MIPQAFQYVDCRSRSWRLNFRSDDTSWLVGGKAMFALTLAAELELLPGKSFTAKFTTQMGSLETNSGIRRPLGALQTYITNQSVEAIRA